MNQSVLSQPSLLQIELDCTRVGLRQAGQELSEFTEMIASANRRLNPRDQELLEGHINAVKNSFKKYYNMRVF